MATAESTHVPVHEAKAKFSEMLRRAAGGEEIVVTSHGTPVARLVPPVSPGPSREEALANLIELRASLAGRATPDEIVQWIREGRRY